MTRRNAPELSVPSTKMAVLNGSLRKLRERGGPPGARKSLSLGLDPVGLWMAGRAGRKPSVPADRLEIGGAPGVGVSAGRQVAAAGIARGTSSCGGRR
jgi:hypothetical protein